MTRRKVLNAAMRTVKLLKPPEPLSISEWSRRNIVLPPVVNTAEPGPFNPDRFPWLRGMLDDLVNPEVSDHVWMIGTRLGKTTCAAVIASYFTAYDPSPILFKYPTQASAEAFSKEQLEPIWSASDSIRAVVAEAKSRQSDNTILFKKFRGGFIALTGANSPTELRRRTVRVVIQDEIDADAPSAGQEGDPVALADRRAETVSNALFLKMSSPTIKGMSRIEALFAKSDQQRFFVPCPKCGFFQVLWRRNLHWPDGRPEDAYIECESCKAHLNDADRIWMIGRGEWRPTASFTGRRGRHISGMYRVIGLKPTSKSYLHEFALGWMDASRSDETRKVWINTFDAEPYEADSVSVSAPEIQKRSESYELVPNQVMVLVAGVDVQHDRIEAEVRGFGEGEESWGIEYAVFTGDPFKLDVWAKLDAWLLKPWQREDGRTQRIYCCGIDSGHATESVYDFCAQRRGRRVYALKGRAGVVGMPLVSIPRKSGVSKVRLYIVGTDTAKSIVYARLNITERGPGCYHFPESYDDLYFESLTSEVIREKWAHGVKTRVFENPGRKRNEALDIACYQLAALTISGVKLNRPHMVSTAPEPQQQRQETPPQQPKPDSTPHAKPKRVLRPVLRII